MVGVDLRKVKGQQVEGEEETDDRFRIRLALRRSTLGVQIV